MPDVLLVIKKSTVKGLHQHTQGTCVKELIVIQKDSNLIYGFTTKKQMGKKCIQNCTNLKMKKCAGTAICFELAYLEVLCGNCSIFKMRQQTDSYTHVISKSSSVYRRILSEKEITFTASPAGHLRKQEYYIIFLPIVSSAS